MSTPKLTPRNLRGRHFDSRALARWNTVLAAVSFAVAAVSDGHSADQTYAGSVVYTGVYFGTFENGGHWAMSVLVPGAPTFNFIGRADDGGETFVLGNSYAAEFFDDGQFQGWATPAINGTIVRGHVEGIAQRVPFSGEIDRGESRASIYAGFWKWTPNPLFPSVDVIVGPSGKAVVAFRSSPTDGEDEVTRVDSNGEFAVTLNRGTRVSGRIEVGMRRLIVAFGSEPLPPAPAGQGQIGNFSVLSAIKPAGAQILQQFSVVGEPNKNLLVRAVGPPLALFRLDNFLQDPAFEVWDGGGVRVAANDNWSSGDAGLLGAMQKVGALPLQVGSLDAAQVVTLPADDYTIVTHSFVPGSSGAVLTELFDLEPEKSQLNQLVSRGRVEANDALVSGFVVSGDKPALVLVRGIGPRLADFGVSDALADPQLKITSSDGAIVAENDDWNPLDVALASAMRRGGGMRFRVPSKDAAVLVSLPPGAYVASVRGSNGASGTAQIEISQPHLSRTSEAALAVELFKVNVTRVSDHYAYVPQLWVYGAEAANPVVVSSVKFRFIGDGGQIPLWRVSKPVPVGRVTDLIDRIPAGYIYGEPEFEFFSAAYAPAISVTLTFLDRDQVEHSITALAQATRN